jgi:hypothetical protein
MRSQSPYSHIASETHVQKVVGSASINFNGRKDMDGEDGLREALLKYTSGQEGNVSSMGDLINSQRETILLG